MAFTSADYVLFLSAVLIGHWALRGSGGRNTLLLVASYVFYGFVHPWFCALIALSTVVDYGCALGMERAPARKSRLLILSLVTNLGLLGTFKYFNFFAGNVGEMLAALGLAVQAPMLELALPAGISFYTFQTLSYTLDVYAGRTRACRNFVTFALFVALFPQLVAGPIERAGNILPQLTARRTLDMNRAIAALVLLCRGYTKKLFIADNVAVYADKVFMLETPSYSLLAAGSLAFAVQIYADFSAYTDIARGSARLIGIELVANFRSPYLSHSPSDFWRRWHITFSTWIRDYLYIPLGGSRVSGRLRMAAVVLVTMGLSGLWHGAAWNFVLWGAYHAVLLVGYRSLGLGGHWRPSGIRMGVAWACMSAFTLFGWAIFRAASGGWLWHALTSASVGLSGDALVSSAAIVALVAVYCAPFGVFMLLDRVPRLPRFVHTVAYAGAMLLILVLGRSGDRDFIYFQF